MEITFENQHAIITFTSQYQQTQQDEDSLHAYYKARFEAQAGHPIPDEEIAVKPKAGEILGGTTTFIVKLGQPLYAGLPQIHQQDNEALPQLINDLDLAADHDLTEHQQELIDHAVGGLRAVTLGLPLDPFEE